MSGFKKCDSSPLNHGAITDQQLAPSKAVTHHVTIPGTETLQLHMQYH